MANFAYNTFKHQLMNAIFDLDNTNTIKVRLVDVCTTADTAKCKTNMSCFGKYSGTTDVEITSETTSQVDACCNLGKFDSSVTLTFSTVSCAGCLNIEGMVVYKCICATDACSIPMVWIEDGGFNITPNGSDIVITWACAGIINLT